MHKRAPGDHGSALDAIKFALATDIGEEHAFLNGWLHGDLTEWPEFYAWLDDQAPASEEPLMRAFPHHSRHPWAQPGDEPDRVFILRFADPDMREQVFLGPGAEEHAHDAYRRYAPAWNVYLFATIPAGEIGAQPMQEAENAQA